MIIVYILLGLIALCLLAMWSYHNKFVTLKERVTRAWKDIDIQLSRRFDLIPNIVETIKGYTKHESETLTKVTELRTGYNNATTVGEKAKIAEEMSSVVRELNVTVEAYPELKANENFMQLQSELKNTEDKIAYSRQFYNDIVNTYNQAIKLFPGTFFAKMFNFEPVEYFEVENEKRENVKVQF